MTELRVVLLTENATLPARASAGAAGYDLFAAADACIIPQGRQLVPTNLAIAVPEGYYARVAPRSGLAWRHGVHVGAGVIDADYRGELKVLLFNLGEITFDVRKGDRIAQLVLERIATPPVVKVESLEDTQRGDGGFGSTGK